jgi:hypothetical protein
MALLMEQSTRTSENCSSQSSWSDVIAVDKPRREKSKPLLLRARLTRAGEFVLGVVLAFVGLLVHVALAVVLLASPFLALVATVLICALLIEGTGLVLRAMGLSG